MFGRISSSCTDAMPNGFPYLVAGSGTLNPRFLETGAWSKVDFSVGWVSDKWSCYFVRVTKHDVALDARPSCARGRIHCAFFLLVWPFA